MRKIFILFILFSSSSAFAQSKSDDFSDSAYSKISISRDSIEDMEIFSTTTTTQSYHIEYSENSGQGAILIDERSIQTSSNASEGMIGQIILSARVSDKRNFDKILWRDTLTANAITYYEDYFQSDAYGCCGAEDAKEIFRYDDGKSILLRTSLLSKVSVPNTKTLRYIGFLSNNYASDNVNTAYNKYYGDTLLAGIVTYIDPRSLSRQLLIIRFKNKLLFDSLGIEILDSVVLNPSEKIDRDHIQTYGYPQEKELLLWSADKNSDPSAVSGFSIDLYVGGDDKYTIEIPIVRDKIDISKLRSQWFTFALDK